MNYTEAEQSKVSFTEAEQEYVMIHTSYSCEGLLDRLLELFSTFKKMSRYTGETIWSCTNSNYDIMRYVITDRKSFIDAYNDASKDNGFVIPTKIEKLFMNQVFL